MGHRLDSTAIKEQSFWNQTLYVVTQGLTIKPSHLCKKQYSNSNPVTYAWNSTVQKYRKEARGLRHLLPTYRLIATGVRPSRTCDLPKTLQLLVSSLDVFLFDDVLCFNWSRRLARECCFISNNSLSDSLLWKWINKPFKDTSAKHINLGFQMPRLM